MAGYTPEEEWSKVLSLEGLFNEVLTTYGYEIYDEYGSYKNISPWMRDQILEWLRKKPYYREMLDAQADDVGGESTLETKIDDLGNRITNLEAMFEHFIKQRKTMKGKDGAGSSKVGSSSKKKNEWAMFVMVYVVCFVCLSSCFVCLSSCFV